MAMLQAVRHFSNSCYDIIKFQIDSLFVQKIINREWTCPWNLENYLEQIRRLKINKHIQVQHILREGNQLADHLANHAINIGEFIFISFQQLQSKENRILNSDKLQCRYMQISPSRG